MRKVTQNGAEKVEIYSFLYENNIKNDFFRQKWHVFKKVTLFLHIVS